MMQYYLPVGYIVRDITQANHRAGRAGFSDNTLGTPVANFLRTTFELSKTRDCPMSLSKMSGDHLIVNIFTSTKVRDRIYWKNC